jgi:hemin uptake protein HemP
MTDELLPSPPMRSCPASRASTPQEGRVIRSEELLGDSRDLVILHAGQSYHLRQTRSGKLILTK